MPPPPRRNKYGARRTVIDGISFDSKREAKRFFELRILERAGEISGLQHQVPFALIGQKDALKSDAGSPLSYVADFVYCDHSTGAQIIEDAKGYRTKEYALKKAIMRAMGYEIHEV